MVNDVKKKNKKKGKKSNVAGHDIGILIFEFDRRVGV
jgi:hypothetical protein